MMVDYKVPICRIESRLGMTVDMLACNLPSFLRVMSAPAVADITCRQHRRSPLSDKETPRVCVDLIFPTPHTELAQFLQLRHLRRAGLPQSTFFGSKSMFGDSNAMIMDINGPSSTHHYWPLCTQMIAVSNSKLLIYTEATVETWTEVMDRVLAMDANSAATKLKWKPSKNGGRPIASPTATTSALAATRRKANKSASMTDYIAEVTVKGEMGKEDAEVLRRLMVHACTVTGFNVKEAADGRSPKTGEFVHLASLDAAAPPGRLRLFLGSEEEVRKFHMALHGQTVQVGQDRIAIELSNDIIDGSHFMGNGRRRR